MCNRSNNKKKEIGGEKIIVKSKRKQPKISNATDEYIYIYWPQMNTPLTTNATSNITTLQLCIAQFAIQFALFVHIDIAVNEKATEIKYP